ncbi:carbohydrate ABC transporter permease [Ferrovibrio sp.]|uniref:carbohydrate ABC transporter permease n=1 Tax=Ferrovibrio sp. TaxID=1917215 RepID=UPI000CBF55EC|nr:carbohydrate ABC transporter permease [Ferrovibrio sp.]PJI40321.1 MAG: sugar ABC transporter permease [Ferrovibrio sp.]
MIFESHSGLLRRLLRGLLSVIIVVAALFPIFWGLMTSLKPTRDIVQFPPSLLPATVTFEHYVTIFKAGAFGFLLNSLLVSAGTVVICLGIGALAAYGLARFEFPGKRAVMVAIIAVMSIPVASLLIPTYTLIAEIGLVNTHIGLILVYSAYQLPIVIWILAAYYQSLPIELEWSAMMDGYSRLQALWKVVLPLSRPGLIAAGLFVVVFAWNDFVVAVTLLSSEETRTLPIGIYNFLGFYGREWGPLLAASMVSTIPLLVVFVILQRYFMAGMTNGSVKG